jgi:predicted XRE-type DNA-binding protein
MTIKIAKTDLEAPNNIFNVVTDSPQEASDLEMLGDLMITIRDLINDKKWTQKKAATILGLTQSSVRNLKNGVLEEFSVDLLMACLYRAGFRFKARYENHILTMNVQSVE